MIHHISVLHHNSFKAVDLQANKQKLSEVVSLKFLEIAISIDSSDSRVCAELV